MFLAHFSGWSHGEIMAMTTNDIFTWKEEALALHNHINSATDGG